MKVVIYCRKSQEDEKRQVQSIPDQLVECKKIIKNRELTLVAPPFKESKSAKIYGARVVFYKMLDFIKLENVDAIVCWEASRLARNGKDGGEIIDLIDKNNLKIITPFTEYNSGNNVTLWIEFCMSTDFSKKLSFNVKRGLMSKVERKEYPGPARLGYFNHHVYSGSKIIKRDILQDENKWDLCRKWSEMQLTGKFSVEQTLKLITDMGLRNSNGNKISKSAAYRFFGDPFFMGLFRF